MRIANKKRFVLSITILTLLIISIFNLVFANVEKSVSIEEYTVMCGDTLWSIAAEYKEDKQDIREYIYKLRKLNNLEDCSLQIGQDILIIK